MSESSKTQRAIELSFIGVLLDEVDRNISKAMSEGVTTEWFEDGCCKAVWDAATSLWAHNSSGTPLEPIAVIGEANRLSRTDPEKYDGSVVDVDWYEKTTQFTTDGSDVEGFIGSLKKAMMSRSLRKAMADTGRSLAETGDVEEALGGLARRLSNIQATAISSEDAGCFDMTIANIKEWEHARHEVVENDNKDFVVGLPLPWKELSKKMRGLQVGMNVIAARPSVGKTSFGLQLAIHFAKMGLHVGFNSLDMPIGQLMKRPVSYLSQIPLEPLENGFATEEDLVNIKKSAEEIQRWQNEGLFQLTQKRNVYDFSSWCSVKHSEGKLDVVFVDYIQKMSAGKHAFGESEMKEVSSVTSSIAQRLNIPVVALAQLNRSNEKAEGGEREPKISDIRESGAIEQDAYTIILLYTDPGVKAVWADEPPAMMDPFARYEPGTALKPVWVNLAKSQNGGRCRLPFVVYENTFSWYLGDRKAEKGSGVGAYVPKFSRITPDGRNKELEHFLGNAGYLVQQQTDDSQSKPIAQSNQVNVKPVTPPIPNVQGEGIGGESYVNDFSAIDNDIPF